MSPMDCGHDPLVTTEPKSGLPQLNKFKNCGRRLILPNVRHASRYYATNK